jgi:hypothetical protein
MSDLRLKDKCSVSSSACLQPIIGPRFDHMAVPHPCQVLQHKVFAIWFKNSSVKIFDTD